ncbi:MAG: response regulator transcription factor [Tissierellia bacterium]|nr:response regulator transcription factor [Tissierellia bacterium]
MKHRVMIVDDQYVCRKMFELYLENSDDYEVVFSIDSAMFADTYVLKDHIDLVLMDILMDDGSSGLEAAEKMKRLNPRVKIIAVTSMPELSWLDRARKIGIDSFWYKEASKETILSVMDHTMEGESVYPDGPPMVQIGNACSHDFTPKEIEILRLLVTGASNVEISEKLEISVHTVKSHVRNLLDKTGYRSRTKLAIQARITGMIIEDEDGA